VGQAAARDRVRDLRVPAGARAIIAGTLYGVSDEFHQTFTPNRSGNDLGDLTADFIGSFIGATAWRLLHKWRADGTKTS